MADHRGLPCGIDSLERENGEVGDRLETFDLGEQPVDETEVPTGDPNEARDDPLKMLERGGTLPAWFRLT
ncbi:hypothetical protein [Paeniglutamicibacter kerguelensis]|uniref:Uncharacterized protein n=2 Tax=Paeniglutamicibacter kerguelensis TaxID=254788 RepID=A0ABS4X9L0_9MICC|nr:hypothetical protein [Paeniglutamicibacter kerguelensis]MBP2385167.1 hypothetical protein [Paeniglutamicibacter kerguelensis]